MLKTIAIILAAGKGTRFGEEIPKQYALLHNKPVIYYSLLTFLEHNLIDAVIPVIDKNHEDVFNNFLKKYNLRNHKKLMNYVFGGLERQHSVFSALEKVNELKDVHKVLIHDCARPFVSNKTITGVINNVNTKQGCIPVLKIHDSLKQVENGFVKNEINRELAFKVQTPQGFPFNKLFNSYEEHINTIVTDDSSLFIKSDLKVTTIEGNILANKITTKEQINYLEKLTAMTEYRTGQGFDVHELVENKDLYLGGVKIPYHKGLLGHSDADVALHALVDAIFGALGKGDIGDHFPPSDPKWKGASSKIFLLKAKELLLEHSATIINIDITILCEEPKLGNYKKIMAENIASVLEIDQERVNVKATTTEKLGFVGRKEGIAALATTSIELHRFNNKILHN